MGLQHESNNEFRRRLTEHTKDGVVFNFSNRILTEELKFHSDWGRLMKVVSKIEGFEDENRFTKYNFDIVQSFIEITEVHTSETIVELDRDTKIEAVYDACVEFIKWYNQQKK
ncbi:MAG TPA: hypothetical protein VIV55_10225 [Flavobacterium sp.]